MKKNQVTHRNRPNGKKLRVSKKTAAHKAESYERIGVIVAGRSIIYGFINRGIHLANKQACLGYAESSGIPRQPELKAGFIAALQRVFRKLKGKVNGGSPSTTGS